jgi:transposase
LYLSTPLGRVYHLKLLDFVFVKLNLIDEEKNKARYREIKRYFCFKPQSSGHRCGCILSLCIGSLAEDSVKRFGTFTADLEALADWLVALGVESVAMESTGIYWVNLYDVLEGKGLKICLANARYVRNVPGRKSDVSDCVWIQQLHSFGLLSGSFIAEGKIRELRAYVRQRETLEKQKGTQISLMGKSLQLLNVKLHQVTSGIELQVSMNIIRSIVAGERDSKKLSAFRHPQMKASKEDLEKSLQGNWRKEHLFSLQQALTFYDFIKEQMLLCEREIEDTLQAINGKEGDGPSPKKATRQNEYAFDVKSHLKEAVGTDLTAIKGLDEKTILTILAETGTDLSRWFSAGHFCSWLGLAPRQKISGEKVLGHFKQSVANRANQAFRLAAWSLHSSKCYLGEFYRKLVFRKGSNIAIKATARKLAVIFYNMVIKKTSFEPHSKEEYNEKFRERRIKKLQKEAAKMGFIMKYA